MSHITLPEGIPGILGPMTAYPETAVHLLGLAEALLRGPSSLTQAERELIATRLAREANAVELYRALGGDGLVILDSGVPSWDREVP